LFEHDINDLFEAVSDFAIEDVREAVARWLQRPAIYGDDLTPTKFYRATWWMSQEQRR